MSVLKHCRFLFLGAPGVGKGTYGKLIGKQLGIPHISAGDILRRELENETILGLQVRPLLLSGQLVPDALIAECIEKELKVRQNEGSNGFILDGFPRTVAQAQLLDKITDIDCALNITLDRWVVKAKLLGRQSCKGCGKSFNSAHIVKPPFDMPAIRQSIADCARGAEFCSEFGSLEHRGDDTDEVIEKRLEVYDATFAPVIDYYQQQNKLKTFNILKGLQETPGIVKCLLSPLP